MLKDPQKAKDLAVPIVQKFLEYDGGDRLSWATDCAKDNEFVHNVQWSVKDATALENDNQPVVVNNEISVARNRAVGQMTDNDPRWVATPRGDGDYKMVGDVSDLMSYIWDTSKCRMHFRKAVEDFEDNGIFILHTYFDPYDDMGRGEIKVIRVSPQLIRLDPKCTWRNAEDSRHIFLTDVLAESEILRKYPDFDFTGAVQFSGDMKQYGSGKIKDGQVFQATNKLMLERTYRVIDDYEKIKVDMFWVYDPTSNFEKVLDKRAYIEFAKQPAIILVRDKQEKVITEDAQVQQVFQILQQYGNIYHEMSDGTLASGIAEAGQQSVNPSGQMVFPIPNSTTQIHVVTMSQLLHEGKIKWQIVPADRIKRSLVIGEKLYRQMVMPISQYPFGITMLHHTDTPYPYGDARLARSVNEQINKINSIILAYNVNLSAMRVFFPKDSQDEKKLAEKFGKAGSQWFTYDPELGGIPVVMQMQQMSSSFFTQIDRLRNFIERIYGVYDFQEGAVENAPLTASGTAQIQESGRSRSRSKLQLIEEALNDIGYVIAEMIPSVYTERKLVHVLRPNTTKAKQVIFNQEVQDGNITRIQNDLTVNRYTIKMMSNSTLPSNRERRMATYLKLYELKAIKDPTPILKYSDLPDIEEIMQNESIINQAQQYIGQLEQTVKMLKGDLQTASREKVHSDQKVLLSKTKAELDALVAKASAGVQLGQARINDKVKDFKRKADEVINETKNSESSNSETQENM